MIPPKFNPCVTLAEMLKDLQEGFGFLGDRLDVIEDESLEDQLSILKEITNENVEEGITDVLKKHSKFRENFFTGDALFRRNIAAEDGVTWVGKLRNNRAWKQKNDKYYLINEKGEGVIEKGFDEVTPFYGKCAAVQLEDSYDWQVIDTSGEPVNQTLYVEMKGCSTDGLLILEDEEGGCDVYNAQGQKRALVGVAEVHKESGHMVRIESHSGKQNFLKSDGKLLFPNWVADAKDFYNGYAAVEMENGDELYWVFVNENGITMSTAYEEAFSFSDGMAAVYNNGKWHLIDRAMSIAYTFKDENDYVDFVSDGIASVWVEKKDKFLLHRIKGNLLSGFGGDEIRPFVEGVCVIRNDMLHEYMFNNGTFVTKEKFAAADDFSEGFARVERHFANKCRQNFLKGDGTLLLRSDVYRAESFKDGVAKITTEEGEVYYIDTNGYRIF